MAHPHELIPGNCYFLLHFCDPDLLFPDITTLRFLEQGQGENGEPLWVFEDAAAAAAAEDSSEPDDALAIGLAAAQLADVLDFPALLVQLGSVAQDHPLRRPKRDLRSALPRQTQFGDLQARIDEFLREPRYAWLTIAIEYTEDGLTLVRLPGGGIEMGFTLNPRTDAQEEARIRGVFDMYGLAPSEDSVSERGRVRSLAYELPGEPGFVQKAAQQIFTDVFDMRAGDGWRFAFHAIAESE